MYTLVAYRPDKTSYDGCYRDDSSSSELQIFEYEDDETEHLVSSMSFYYHMNKTKEREFADYELNLLINGRTSPISNEQIDHDHTVRSQLEKRAMDIVEIKLAAQKAAQKKVEEEAKRKEQKILVNQAVIQRRQRHAKYLELKKEFEG
jgi:hypothetical protein